MKIKTIVVTPEQFGNLKYGDAYGLGELNKQLSGAGKVDIFMDHNGSVTFVAQWPDDAEVPE